MAGKEQTGPDAADASLFHGATYCIIPGHRARQEAVKSVVGLAEILGAIPFFMDAQEHDSFAAAASHLPMILSTILMTSVTNSQSWDEISKLTSTGFGDISRLASSDPEMNRDICLTNPNEVIYWIDEFIRELYDFRNRVKEGQAEDIIETFIKSWEARAKWMAGVPKRKDPSMDAPRVSVSDSATQMLLGERLARRRREMQEKTKKDPLKYFRKRQRFG